MWTLILSFTGAPNVLYSRVGTDLGPRTGLDSDFGKGRKWTPSATITTNATATATKHNVGALIFFTEGHCLIEQ